MNPIVSSARPSGHLDGHVLDHLLDDLATEAASVTELLPGGWREIEVPGVGRPVVLGPDHPTTGGYPVIAVVPSSAWGAVGAWTAGDRVRWVR